MDSIKLYFEIIFKVFVWLSIVFITFKLFLISTDLKKSKKKKGFRGYSLNMNGKDIRHNDLGGETSSDIYIGGVMHNRSEGRRCA